MSRWVLWLVVLLAAGILVLAAVRPVAAGDEAYTPDDTFEAIHQAAEATGVSEAWLYRTVSCETAQTFNPYAVGHLGELGAAQLAPWGELNTFYKWRYVNPYNPYEAIMFMAQRFGQGGWTAWSCA